MQTNQSDRQEACRCSTERARNKNKNQSLSPVTMSSSSSPSFKLQYSLIRIICLVFMLASSTYVSAAGNPLVRTSSSFFRSLYSFGDSFVDPGNNNFIATRARSNFPPYGRDFFNCSATGRFSNGLLFPDFLAYYLGDKELQQPYLDPKLSLQWPLAAVSFASATSGFDPLTSNITNAISMAKQLEYFKEYKSKLQRRFGKRKAESQIQRALFYINAGSDDIAFSFFGDGTSGPRGTSPLPDYEHFLLDQVQQFIQGLSDQGARRFAVSGLPPLGCIPVAITRLPRNSSLQRNCLGYVNSISEEFNELLQVALKATQSKLSKLGTKIAYIDFNQPLLNLIQNPGHYGFREVNKGCCGTGLYEIGLLCNQTSKVCGDASEYVFWDAAHPSQKTYQNLFFSNLPAINQIIRG